MSSTPLPFLQETLTKHICQGGFEQRRLNSTDTGPENCFNRDVLKVPDISISEVWEVLPARAAGGIFSKCLAALNYCLWLLESAGTLLTTDISFDVRVFWAVQLNVKIV